MVLGHQGLNNNMSGPSGLQPGSALQLAAVAAAHLAPRSRVSWAPFLQFGMTNPMLFGAPFLTRPHFNNGGHNHQIISVNNNTQSSGLSSNRSIQSQQSEDSNDERGKLIFFKKIQSKMPTVSLFTTGLIIIFVVNILSFICFIFLGQK